MITVQTNNEGLTHEIYEFLRIIFPEYERDKEKNIVSFLVDDIFSVKSESFQFEINVIDSRDISRDIKRNIITYAKNQKIYVPEWGILHGIRPIKLIDKYLNEMGSEKTKYILKNKYLISDKKINLAYEVIERQKNIVKNHKENYSVYVHIPFCPTKCTYCSYHTLNSNSPMVEDYVNQIIEDIKYESLYLPKNPSAIYIGGGTPTSIGTSNLEKIIVELKNSFLDTAEFTVEAGRVETLTDDMLNMLSSYNIDRISINPQSMNENTILKINRTNSINEFTRCYDKAKGKFKDINMDLIIGLEEEKESEFIDSLNKVINLNPTNITVHSLAIKNGAEYLNKKQKINISSSLNDRILEIMENNHYNPYYLYRQKRILGGNENIGYSLHGHECIYNIMMIQETQNIWGFGMGSTSKIFTSENKFEQIANFRNINDYLLKSKIISDKKISTFLNLNEVENEVK